MSAIRYISGLNIAMEFYHSQLVEKVGLLLREIQSELVVEINKGIFSFKALKLKRGKINYCAPNMESCCINLTIFCVNIFLLRR